MQTPAEPGNERLMTLTALPGSSLGPAADGSATQAARYPLLATDATHHNLRYVR